MPEEIAGCEYGFVFLSSILHAHVGELFTGMTVEGCYQFRVTRNSTLFVDDEETKNLREPCRENCRSVISARRCGWKWPTTARRRWRLFCWKQFELDADALYRSTAGESGSPDAGSRLGRPPDLKFPLRPALPDRLTKQDDIFAHIRKNDILLHHPFESFQPVIDFIEQAAADPHVVAMRQTVYRTGTDSKLMQALIQAAQSGKEVIVWSS